ncbi:MAG: hypothetical protein ACYDAO_07245 [Thermoplasmataceae archaeon]
MEFWNSDITNESWKMLIEFSKEFKFLLIDGWAIYLYTHLHKSKDIDIIVNYDEFSLLANKYSINKNPILKKYEITLQKFDIDIYLPFFSKLALPPEDLMKRATIIENIKVPRVEELLILKIGAFLDRSKSIKGNKDLLDIAGLVFYYSIDFKRFKEVLEEYALTKYLEILVNSAINLDKRLLPYLNFNENTYSKAKKELLENIQSI